MSDSENIMEYQTMKSKIIPLLLCGFLSFTFFTSANAQVKITDGTVITLDPNSILELESSNKGLLIPRVAINNLNLPSPLSAPVPAGMLVYSSGGTVNDGFYFWDGSGWNNLLSAGNTATQFFTKSADDTLTKANSIIFASNDITLTLPQITSADTALQITVNNVGSHIHQVVVTGYGSTTIEGLDSIDILPRLSKTFVARGADWIMTGRNSTSDDIMDVGHDEAFQSLSDAIEYLEVHMEGPAVLRLGSETVYLEHTETIDLPFALTIQGSSYGSGTIVPAPGLEGKPMFRCLSETYFKMLIFDATPLAGYGTSPGEDAIRLVGSGEYHEIKDSSFDGFYNAVVDSSNAELWIFECDIVNAVNSGLILHSSQPGASVKVSETDFTDCKNGILLSKGSLVHFNLMNGVFTTDSTDNAIVYNPTNFSFSSVIITNNQHNAIGNGLVGFDFTRPDGRDANSYIENNPGFKTSLPNCKLNVINNNQSVTCNVQNEWYKAAWTNTSFITTNFLVNDNRITYQPATLGDIVIFISGNVLVNNPNKVITIGIVRNGITSYRYGETTLRVTTANQPFQFSTVIYIVDVHKGDYFELFCSSQSNGDILKFQDINWFVNSE